MTPIIAFLIVIAFVILMINVNSNYSPIKGTNHYIDAQGAKADDKSVQTHMDKTIDIKLTAQGAQELFIKKDPEHGDLDGVDQDGLVTNENNIVTYIPDEGYIGKDSFTVKPSVLGPAEVGVISIDVMPVNNNNVIKADDQFIKIEKGKSKEIKLTASNSDQQIGFLITGDPEHGDLDGVDQDGLVTNENNIVTYIPDEGYIGKDSFTVKPSVSDQSAETGVISIQVISISNPNPNPNPNPDPNSNKLLAKIQVDKDPINLGEKQTIIINALDKKSNRIVGNGIIHGMIIYDNGYIKKFSDNDGKASYSWNIDSKTNPGIFKVSAEISANGYDSISDSQTFEVIKQGLETGKKSWNFNSNSLIIGVIGLLVIGTLIGAYAKHRSSKKNVEYTIRVITQGGTE